jgi:hypothetical protein
MKETILCAIDFNDSSNHALRWAIQMANCSKASLTVQYSYRLIPGKSESVLGFRKKTEEEARQRYKEMITNVKDCNVTDSDFISEIGFYSDNIENFIRKNPVTMVIMSQTLCHTIYDHKGLSSNDFIKGLSVPIMVIPDVSQANFCSCAQNSERVPVNSKK